MEPPPHINCIKSRLQYALPHFLALPGMAQLISSGRQNGMQFERVLKNLLEGEDDWFAEVPALMDVQDWVETHWDPERQTQPPGGTLATGQVEGHAGEIQLDSRTAACKLLWASAFYGAGSVANCATEFEAHGMIEVRTFYLLKGPAVSSPKPLDSHCTILPYRDALQSVRIVSGEELSTQALSWPKEDTNSVSVLDVRSFERRSLKANLVERHESPLMRSGPETFALILGLVWAEVTESLAIGAELPS